jgi:hypothetical protein
MKTQPIFTIAISLVGTFFLSASWAETQNVPCVNANATSAFLARTMTIRVEGKPEILVEGTITSLNTSNGEIRVRVVGLAEEQAIQAKTVRLAPKPQNMMAQVALPIRQSLGSMNAKYALKSVTVEQGVVRFPNCIMADERHEIAFAGTLTFEANELAIDGEFFDYTFPHTAPDLTGRSKPGA